MTRNDEHWWVNLRTVLASGPALINGPEELDRALAHVVSLLVGASITLDQGLPHIAIFLAITALEETAKTHVGMYRRSDGIPTRRNDPLYNHKEKHALAAAPTVTMGSRLQKAIGEEKLDDLLQRARTGNLAELRERALYLEREHDVLKVPAGEFDRSCAICILLFAIEAFDDALVGYTNCSFELGKRTDVLFEKWAAT